MTLNAILETAPELTATDYIVMGVATCFRREEGELETVHILEPIPSAYLESLFQGIPTAYATVIATTLGDLLKDFDAIAFSGVPEIHLCENFRDRIIAAARTYRNQPDIQSRLSVGTRFSDFNYSTEKKRVLNFKNVVKAEDNVRQHAHTHKRL